MNHISEDKTVLQHHAGWGRYPGITAIDPIKNTGNATGPSYKDKPKKRKSGGYSSRYWFFLCKENEAGEIVMKGSSLEIAKHLRLSRSYIENVSITGTKIMNRYVVRKERKEQENGKDGQEGT